MAYLRASLSPAARTVYKYSLGLDEADQKKPHCVVAALREYYGASIGVSGERQKFLRLLQNENESIASWETRVRHQAAQCEYEDYADKLMWDQHSNCHSVSGVAATINSPVNSIAQHLAKDLESAGSMVISRLSVEVGQDDKDDSSNRIFSMMTTMKKRLWRIARHLHSR